MTWQSVSFVVEITEPITAVERTDCHGHKCPRNDVEIMKEAVSTKSENVFPGWIDGCKVTKNLVDIIRKNATKP